MTFPLLHPGQLTRFLSRSERVIFKVNFFLQAVQVYSYVGIPSPSFAQRVASSRHVGAYECNYISNRHPGGTTSGPGSDSSYEIFIIRRSRARHEALTQVISPLEKAPWAILDTAFQSIVNFRKHPFLQRNFSNREKNWRTRPFAYKFTHILIRVFLKHFRHFVIHLS